MKWQKLKKYDVHHHKGKPLKERLAEIAKTLYVTSLHYLEGLESHPTTPLLLYLTFQYFIKSI